MSYTRILPALFLLATPVLAQDFALERLNDSPRHHEWVTIENDGRGIHAFVAYPERSDSATAIVVIHENRGLTDWVRSFADQLAEAGYLAVAPDLLSDFDSEHDRTSDFATSDDARNAIYELDPDQVISDLHAVESYAARIPASNGETVVAGFCWGGSQSFRFATESETIKAAMVFYGTAPTEEEAIAGISAPVYGFYGGDDERVNATIPETEEMMEAHDNTYEYDIYEGAGHAFMRSGDDPEGSQANREARDAAFERSVRILGEL